MAQHQPKTAGAYAAVSLLHTFLDNTIDHIYPSGGVHTSISAAVLQQVGPYPTGPVGVGMLHLARPVATGRCIPAGIEAYVVSMWCLQLRRFRTL